MRISFAIPSSDRARSAMLGRRPAPRDNSASDAQGNAGNTDPKPAAMIHDRLARRIR
jgi:hypothetical protein